MRAHSYCLASISRSPASATRQEKSSQRIFSLAHSSSVIACVLADAPPVDPALAGASAQRGKTGQAHQQGSLLITHHGFTFAPVHLVIQPVIRLYFFIEAPMEQLPLRLLCRLDALSVVPPSAISAIKTYRDAVRLCWDQRRVRNMTRTRLAEEAGLYAPHVTGYLNDKAKNLRNLPAEKVAAFERACGNTAVSQWIAAQARLTVLEEMQAERIAA